VSVAALEVKDPMICAKCKATIFPGPYTIEKVRHGEVIYSHRICPRRLKAPKRKTYQLKKPEKRGWIKARQLGVTSRCEVSGYVFATVKARRQVTYMNRIVDHIVPERLAVTTGKNPHARINLICLHSNEHGRKRSAEDQLLKSGNMLHYLQELNRLGWPMDRVHAALKFYGIKHTNGVCVFCDTMEAGLQAVKTDPPSQHTQENKTDGNPPG
jgi:hypothetical protein